MNFRKEPVANKLTRSLLMIYLILLCWVLLFKLGVRFSYMEKRSVNIIPFNEPFLSNGKMNVGEIILNILIFVPLGIYAGLLFKRWAWGAKVFFFFLISFLFEALQYIFRIGAFDSTDIITNTSGGIIGLMTFNAIEKLFNNPVKTHKFINIIATTGTVLIISLLALLKMNMLPIKYQ